MPPKTYVLDRKNPILADLFRPKKLLGKDKPKGFGRDAQPARTKLGKGALRAHLSRRYKGPVAEKILAALPMAAPLELDEYADMVERLLNYESPKLLRMGFNVLDFNEDKQLDELDMYAVMRTYDDDEEVFVNAFSYDLCTIAEELKAKQQRAGIADAYIHDKMEAVQRALHRKAGKGGDPGKQAREALGRLAKFQSVGSSDPGSMHGSGSSPSPGLGRKSRRPTEDATALGRTNTSKTSFGRRSSRAGGGSRGDSPGSAGATSSRSLYDDAGGRKARGREHPYDKVFGKHVTHAMAARGGAAPITIPWAEYGAVQWPHAFPDFIVDLIQYLTGFQIPQFLEDRCSRREEEKNAREIAAVFKQQRDEQLAAGGKVDEKALKGRIVKEHMNVRQKRIEDLKVRVTPLVYADIWRFFHFMRQNINEDAEHKVFLTEHSLRLNLSKYFGHKTDLLTARLYTVLGGGRTGKRIFVDDFIEQLYVPLWESEDPLARARLMFRMLDFDGDGYLHACDLVRAQELVDAGSDFGGELQKLVDFYVRTQLKNRGPGSDHDKINLHKYKWLTELGGATEAEVEAQPAGDQLADGQKKPNYKSCALEELKTKSLAEPEAHKAHSVFIASKAQLERAKKLEEQIKEMIRLGA